MKTWLGPTLFFLLALIASGCGGNTMPDCSLQQITVSPTSATANHLSSPGNTQQFLAFGVASPGCAVIQSNLTNVTWSVSDTTNVSISNVHDATFGVATCNAATAGPVTVTANMPSAKGGNIVATAALTCN